MSTDAAMGRIPDLTLGWRLQMALQHGGVSAQEMADDLGVSRSTVSRWLNDHGAAPRAAYVKQWALRTHVSYAWLSTGSDGTAIGPRPAMTRDAGRARRPRHDSNVQPTGLTAEGQEDGTGRLASVHPLTPRPRIRHLAGTASAVVIPLRRRSA